MESSMWVVDLVLVGLAVVGVGLARTLWNERQLQVEGKVVGLGWWRVLHRETFEKTFKREWKGRLVLQPGLGGGGNRTRSFVVGGIHTAVQE
jgi:hypothetical protein